MMVPFILGVLEKEEAALLEEGRSKDIPKVKTFGKGLLIGIAWAASIGGSATLIGTTGPAILSGYHSANYPNENVNVNFATWMAFAIGPTAVNFVIAYGGLSYFYCSKSTAAREMNKDNLRRALDELGRMKYDEWIVAAAQTFQIVFWFLNGVVLVPMIGECTGATATDKYACGDGGGTWTSRFTSFESGIACLAALSLFLIPSRQRPGERILDWVRVSLCCTIPSVSKITCLILVVFITGICQCKNAMGYYVSSGRWLCNIKRIQRFWSFNGNRRSIG